LAGGDVVSVGPLYGEQVPGVASLGSFPQDPLMAAVYRTTLVVALEEFFGRVQIFGDELTLAKYCQLINWDAIATPIKFGQLGFEERRNETLVVGQRGQHFWRRERDVKEISDAVLTAQCLGGRHQVIVMNPDEITFSK
jgi:hypothetical protein